MILSLTVATLTTLAQVDPVAASGTLAKDPLAYMLLVVLGALAYIHRDAEAQKKDLRKEISDLNLKLAETLRESAKDQRDTITAQMPVLLKLSEGLEILERVANQLSKD